MTPADHNRALPVGEMSTNGVPSAIGNAIVNATDCLLACFPIPPAS